VTDYRAIYAEHADRYHELVSAEDARGELPRALAAMARLRGADALDVGAGTGRVTRLLCEAGARVTALEASPAMLAVARRELGRRATLIEGDARALPFADGSFDVVVAGWVFGHFRHWNEPGWREDVGRAVGEMRRVARPGGVVAVIETLGTGQAEPGAPNALLAEYYAWLEADGFERRAIRTDYRFADAESAATLTGFFFGDEFGARVRSAGARDVVEWTGIWSCRLAGERI
jgi:ubiquinone/menaquinone biosynthesis C-methylase UbiE